MSEHAGLARRFAEIVNGGDAAAFAEIVAPGYVQHNPMVANGLDGLKTGFAAFLAAFPDLRVRLEAIASDGDQLVARFSWRGTHHGEFFGTPATGKTAEWGSIDWWRIEDGKLAEHWDQVDWQGLMRQLEA